MDHNLDMFTIEPRTVYYLPGRCTNVQTLGLGSRGASRQASMSGPPPAANGTTIFIGRDG